MSWPRFPFERPVHRRGTIAFFAAPACFVFGLATPIPAQDTSADFTIHSQVMAANPPRFGFNLAQSIYYADITDNTWIIDGAFSSSDIRMNYQATDDGATDGTTFIATDLNNPGTDYYNSINSNGAFVGANARVYRFNTTSNQWNLIRTGVVQSMTAVSGSNLTTDHTITFTTGGAQTKAGDAIWLSKDGNYQNPDVSQWVNDLTSRFSGYSTSFNAEGESLFARNDTNACTYTHVTDVPPGQTNGQADAPPLSVKVTDSATGTGGIWQYVQGWSNGGEELETGHTYTVSVWLKQQGIADGSVTFIFGPLKHVFTGVTAQWQQYTYNFPSPGPLNATGAQTARVDYNAPGTLWVNQLQFYDASHAAFTLDPRALQAFQNFHPGSIRLWSGFGNTSSNYSFWSVDSMLQDESADREDLGIGNIYGKFTVQQKLPAGLALCSQLSAVPWIICNMSWSEQEWSNLIDYLAAPAGVGYAAKRPSSHPGPYTADFSRIYLEFGNEEWGTQETAVNGHYGNYAHYMFSQAIAGKSYYDSSKLKLILNSFTNGDAFGQTALVNCPEGQALDYFLYTGTANTSGDTVYQDDLLSIVTYKSSIDQWVASEKTSAAAGHPYEITSYEGGPGVDNPNAQGGGDTSLAAAAGQLDVYLYAQLAGATSLNFFLYHLDTPTSTTYSSHTNFAHGYIPHPVWEALQMRNQYCAGDMVGTDTNTVQVTSDGKSTPLAAIYTFHDTTGGGNQADIVVISRDLNNSTPVTLHLPTQPTGGAMLYTLTGDPRANNESSLVVPIGQQTLSTFSKDDHFTLPAGSVYLFQVPTAAWPAVGPSGFAVQGGTGFVSLNWAPLPGALTYNVYRSTSPTGGASVYATGISGTTYTDSGVTNGTTYYYGVTAATAAGETDRSAQIAGTPVAAGPFIALNAGGTAVSGTKWIADTDNDGGGFTESAGTQAIPASLVNPAPEQVYQTARARGTYTIPGLTPGSPYTVRLHGKEAYWTSAGNRLQDVILNGVTVDTDLDWFKLAGGPNIAAIRSYSIVEPASGNLVLSTIASTGSPDYNAEISGIEVLSGSVPLAPSNVTISVGNGQANLNWTAAPGATTYTVRYGTGSGSYTQSLSGITGTSAVITGLVVATTYYFVVTGGNADGDGALSAEINSNAQSASTDTPAMPAWALAVMASILLYFGLRRGSQIRKASLSKLK